MTNGVVLVLVQALAVALAVALALALWLVLRRAGEVLAETRDVDRFRRTMADLGTRIGVSLDGVAARIDAVRRHTVPAEAIADNLSAASDAIERYAAEVRAVSAPRGGVDLRDQVVAELERAGRAIQMAEHGCSILASARIGGRELEAQTAVKRAYLNLLHAREAIGRHVTEAERLAGPDDLRLFRREAAERSSAAARDHRI